ncbi:hypothetical protein SCUCBS95973_003642 [Sporothrix curviconia]|uniref:HNH nuclease domain-containing protein n=1 Tax=Sporothrix curviconia TaxID=1260050 RepID=A0ABP0BH02_9PEZI
MDNTLPAADAAQDAMQQFAAVHARNPKLAHDVLHIAEHDPTTVSSLAADIPCPSGNIDPFITDVQERWKLLTDFRILQQQKIGSMSVDIFSTALFMVIPLPRLTEIVESAADHYLQYQTRANQASGKRDNRPLVSSALKRSATAAGFDESSHQEDSDRKDADGMQTTGASPGKMRQTTHPGNQPSSSAAELPKAPLGPLTYESVPPSQPPVPTTTSTRSQAAATATRARDGNACILTGVCMPDAAHIFPHSAAKSPETKVKLDILFGFWGEETREKWGALFKDRAVTESPQNELSLGKHMHCMWDKVYFALKPVSATDREVTVQFHWIKRDNCRALTAKDVLANPNTFMKEICSGDARGWGIPQVAHRQSGARILTGQLFTIRADKPEHLPSMELLQLQWDLMKVASMTGAADMYDDYDYDYDNWMEGNAFEVDEESNGEEYSSPASECGREPTSWS